MTHSADRLDGTVRTFVAEARRAVLATLAADGRSRLVPVCFVIVDDRAWIPIDRKPKRSADPLDLARVRDVLERPAVALLVDRWDEDWSRLAWVRLEGQAAIAEPAEPDHPAAAADLRAKYPQYVAHDLGARPMIRVAIERATWWGDLGD